MEIFLLFAIVFALLVLRQNIIVILGVVVIYCYMVFGDGEITNVVLDMWDASNRDILLSIPLYILAGALMAKGTIAERLIGILRELTKPIRGGLALAACLSCGVFSAISGSSIVTMLAVGSIMYPALLKAGYDKRFSIGLIAAGGTLGIIIPPSIPLILYGVITQTSIADLFLAGVGPGILLLSMFALYALAKNRDKPAERMDIRALARAFKRGIFALLLPVVILGGIYSGYFTPTESAAVAVLLAVIVEVFVHRDLKVKDVGDATIETALLIGGLFPVLALALSLNVFLVYQQVPAQLVETMSTVFTSEIAFILTVNVLLLVIGCLIDVGSAILILGPLLQPIAANFGIDPVRFGIMMIMNLEIGYLTPPVGLNLIVAMAAFKEDFWEICKAVIPFVFIMLLALALVTIFPQIALFLIR